MDEKIQNLFDRLDVRTGEYDGSTFAIIWDWDTIYQTVVEVNDLKKEDLIKYGCNPDSVEDYWDKIEQYGDLRLGRDGKPAMESKKSPYLVPDGLKDFEQILEENDIKNWGFADEYDFCDQCKEVIRTSPDSYGWYPPYHRFEDGDLICESCFDEHEGIRKAYLQEVKNQLKGCNLIDPEEFGFQKLDFDFATGLHEWANDDPEVILEKLNDAGVDVLFDLSNGQFTTAFTIYVPDERLEQATAILNGSSVKYPVGKSPAEQCKKALKDAEKKSKELEGQPGITYSKMKPDGTADVRKVSEEEFLKGIKD